jgi:hypothetical protein
MGEIEYCEQEVQGPSWHPALAPDLCPDDDWGANSYSVWQADPETYDIQREKESLNRALFEKLAKEWRDETKFTPTLKKMVMHRAYQRIMALGWIMVPYILEDLEKNGPDHWFWALHFITDEDPAKGATTIDDAAAAWIKWGREDDRLRRW